MASLRLPLCLGLALLAPGMAGAQMPSASRGPDARQEILLKLKQCRADVRAQDGSKWFLSPCAHLDVRPLSGVAIAQLEATLGPRDVSSGDYVPAPQRYESRWAFYRLPRNVANGGGPELQCVSDDRRICTEVRWVRTE
jgi:hypothetical protein